MEIHYNRGFLTHPFKISKVESPNNGGDRAPTRHLASETSNAGNGLHRMEFSTQGTT